MLKFVDSGEAMTMSPRVYAAFMFVFFLLQCDFM